MIVFVNSDKRSEFGNYVRCFANENHCVFESIFFLVTPSPASVVVGILFFLYELLGCKTMNTPSVHFSFIPFPRESKMNLVMYRCLFVPQSAFQDCFCSQFSVARFTTFGKTSLPTIEVTIHNKSVS